MRSLRKLVNKLIFVASFALLLGTARPSIAQTTVVVSGDLQTLLGQQIPGVSGQTYVIIRLKNWSGNIPRVSGTGILASSSLQNTVVPDSTGHFSTSVYGNDAVTPSNTYYEVQFWQNGRLVTAGLYSFTQALCPSGCNLDTYPQLNPAPTPAISVAPFLGTNNTFTGTNTFNGAVTFNSTVVFGLGAQTFQTPTFTPPITINTTNHYTWSFNNPATARTITWPDPGANDTVAFLGATQTLSNKTLSSPTSTGTDAGTETLQNKTLDAGTVFNSATAAKTNALGTIHLPTVNVFTSGSGTYTTPTGATMLHVRLVGGGGGGAGSGSSAGSGTVGGSTFGTSLLTANGGNNAAAGGGPGTGGTATGGNINVSGGSGYDGNFSQTFSGFGNGGASFFGGGGSSGGGAGQNGQAPGSGGGGGGASSTAVVTGPGGGAGAYVEAWITNPAASYSYAVGAAGSGGTAGTSGFAGGNGAAGLIIVEAY